MKCIQCLLQLSFLLKTYKFFNSATFPMFQLFNKKLAENYEFLCLLFFCFFSVFCFLSELKVVRGYADPVISLSSYRLNVASAFHTVIKEGVNMCRK